MTRRPYLSTTRAAEVWSEVIDVRRELYSDSQFFKMHEPWETMCSESEHWSINAYKSNELEDHKRKAGVVVLDDRVTLTVDQNLMANAKKGCNLSNFILAHEWGHLALDHHARNAVTKNFQLYAGKNGLCNLPPTLEELEANYAAVFFQCGVALADPRWESTELARRAFSDFEYVKKAMSIFRVPAFQYELKRPKPRYKRVVL